MANLACLLSSSGRVFSFPKQERKLFSFVVSANTKIDFRRSKIISRPNDNYVLMLAAPILEGSSSTQLVECPASILSCLSAILLECLDLDTCDDTTELIAEFTGCVHARMTPHCSACGAQFVDNNSNNNNNYKHCTSCGAKNLLYVTSAGYVAERVRIMTCLCFNFALHNHVYCSNCGDLLSRWKQI